MEMLTIGPCWTVKELDIHVKGGQLGDPHAEVRRMRRKLVEASLYDNVMFAAYACMRPSGVNTCPVNMLEFEVSDSAT